MLHGRTLKWSAWLGWQIESNWTTPWLFAGYVLLKPLAGSLLVVCMYWAARTASGGATPSEFLPYLYISSACFMVVSGVTSGMSNSVVTDRESYKMLKYIRMSPIPFSTYLVGRGLARAGQSALGAILTVGVGWLIFPDLRQRLGRSSDRLGLAAFESDYRRDNAGGHRPDVVGHRVEHGPLWILLE